MENPPAWKMREQNLATLNDATASFNVASVFQESGLRKAYLAFKPVLRIYTATGTLLANCFSRLVSRLDCGATRPADHPPGPCFRSLRLLPRPGQSARCARRRSSSAALRCNLVRRGLPRRPDTLRPSPDRWRESPRLP